MGTELRKHYTNQAGVYQQVWQKGCLPGILNAHRSWIGSVTSADLRIHCNRFFLSSRLSDELVTRTKTSIRAQLSARHVPAVILETKEIPYTASGKKVEVAVKKIISGETVTNRGAFANPNALDLYSDIPELKAWFQRFLVLRVFSGKTGNKQGRLELWDLNNGSDTKKCSAGILGHIVWLENNVDRTRKIILSIWFQTGVYTTKTIGLFL